MTTYALIETPQSYRAIVAPLLLKMEAQEPLEPAEQEVVNQLDRCFRFFYVCSVLNRDLGTDEGALNRAYYHYIRTLLDDSQPELCRYLERFYPRLCAWIKEQASPEPHRRFFPARAVRPRRSAPPPPDT